MTRASLRLALLVSPLAFLHTAVAAPDEGACCAMNTSRADSLLNPTKGSDEKFFTQGGGAPSVMFLVGNNASMQDFVVQLPTGARGCTDAALTGPIGAFFNRTSTDPARNGSVPIDPDPDFNGSGTEFFNPGEFFRVERSKMKLGTTYSLDSNFRGTSGTTSTTTACSFGGITAADRTTCEACLSSGPGWYRYSDTNWAVSGRLLNVNPPKFVLARKVLKDVVDSLDNVRLGISHFGPNTGFYDAPVMLHPVKPGCDQSFPFAEGSLRPDVRKQINMVEFDNNERSIGEALFGLGGYFSSEKTKNTWTNWFYGSNRGTVPSGHPGTSGWDDGADMWTDGVPWEAGGQQLSVCWPCQQTAVIVLSDGRPEADNSVPISRMLGLLIAQGAKHPDGTPVTFNPGVDGVCPNNQRPGGINYCNDFAATKCDCDYNGYPSGPDITNANYMDDVAFFLSHMDLREDYPGQQSVRTYTIGFGDNSPMLQSIAKAGDGLFYRADNATQLRAAIVSAVEDIKARSNAYTGAAVATVQAGSTGATTAAVLPRMLARANKPWVGSLWRFEQFNEFTQDLDRNVDGDKNDIFLVDAADDIVQEDTNGNFVKRGTATPAAKFWEANERL